MTELSRADGVNRPSARLGPQGNLRASDWLYRSRAASLLWLLARLWLGYPRRSRRLSQSADIKL